MRTFKLRIADGKILVIEDKPIPNAKLQEMRKRMERVDKGLKQLSQHSGNPIFYGATKN